MHAAEEGYKVTKFDGAIIEPHSAQMKALIEQGRTISLGVGDMATADAFAVKEYGAVHGVIAGMPAGGAAGVPVSTIPHAVKHLRMTKEDGIKALMTAAIIGIFYYPTHYHGAWGCQAEVGISISMTAGAVASLISDDLDVIERAAVLGAQSILGRFVILSRARGKFPASSATLRPFRLPLPGANAALGGCETLTSLDEMAETLLRVGIKLKTMGLNDMGVCYYDMQCTNKGKLRLHLRTLVQQRSFFRQRLCAFAHR